MAYFLHQGRRIAYDDHGEDDRPLVLVHGLLMNRRMFDRLAPEMAARGNRVLTIDLLGHGASDRPPEMVNYSMSFFAEQGRVITSGT
jgi:pimeloyl-ACP methyl ester carboxylesterase